MFLFEFEYIYSIRVYIDRVGLPKHGSSDGRAAELESEGPGLNNM